MVGLLQLIGVDTLVNVSSHDATASLEAGTCLVVFNVFIVADFDTVPAVMSEGAAIVLFRLERDRWLLLTNVPDGTPVCV